MSRRLNRLNLVKCNTKARNIIVILTFSIDENKVSNKFSVTCYPLHFLLTVFSTLCLEAAGCHANLVVAQKYLLN